MSKLKNWLYISKDEQLNYVEHFLHLKEDISIEVRRELPKDYDTLEKYDHIALHVSDDILEQLNNHYRREQLTTLSWLLLYHQLEFQTIRQAVHLMGVTSCFYLQQSLPKLFDAIAMVNNKQLYVDTVFLENIIMIKRGDTTASDNAADLSQTDTTPIFTNKEYFLLEALLKGQPLKELAQQLHTSKESVSYHYKKLRNRCDVVNNHQLIAKVMANGWIAPSSYSHLICRTTD